MPRVIPHGQVGYPRTIILLRPTSCVVRFLFMGVSRSLCIWALCTWIVKSRVLVGEDRTAYLIGV